MKKIIIKKTRNGEYRFNLKGKNGESVGTSETYTKKAMAYKTIAKYFVNWVVEDQTTKK